MRRGSGRRKRREPNNPRKQSEQHRSKRRPGPEESRHDAVPLDALQPSAVIEVVEIEHFVVGPIALVMTAVRRRRERER